MTPVVGKSASVTERAAQRQPLVFIVDGDLLVRATLGSLVRLQGWQPLAFGSASEFLDAPRVAGPSCLLLDFVLPDISGLDLQQCVRDRRDMPVIFATRHTDVQVTVQALKAGAFEYLIKPVQDTHLLTVLGAALTRSKATQQQDSALRQLEERCALLTNRELEIMCLVVSGWLNKQVGSALSISEGTVKAHRASVMRKMKASSLAELVRMAGRLSMTPHARYDGASGHALERTVNSARWGRDSNVVRGARGANPT